MENGNSTRKRSRKIRYFYLGDKHHKVIHIVRSSDLVVAWSYKDKKRIGYVWSDVKKNMDRALKTNEVASIVNRHRTKVDAYICDGKIKPPEKAYTLDGRFLPSIYLWKPQDVLDLHDYLLTVNHGKPRKDGIINPWRLPTRSEVRAMLEHDTILYVKKADGNFSPVWKEHSW